jgi:hypothetical protein
MSLAGYLHSMFVLGVSMFYVMRLLQSFIGSGNYSIVGPCLFKPSDGAFTAAPILGQQRAPSPAGPMNLRP